MQHGRVPNLEHEVELVEDLEAWHRSSSGGIQHRFPLRFSATPGRYLLDLPAAPVELALEAPGYRYRRVRVRAGTTRTSAPLAPRGSAPTAMLRLRPRPGEEAAPIAMPVVIVDEDMGWHRVVDLVPGGVDVQVPPGRDLFLASVGAQDGFWTPKRAVRSPAAGELLEVAVGLRAARRIRVAARRPLNGALLLKDTKQAALEHPLRAELRGGRAVLWGRPGRELLLEVRYEGNYFVERVQVTPGHDEVSVDLPVTAGAGVNVAVADSQGNPIPFAEVRLWPPAADGVYSLHHRPQVEFSDADGIAAFLRLQPGQAAVQVRADGYGRKSVAQVRLKQGELTRTPLQLAPAVVRRGRIVDPDGKRLAGVWIQALLYERLGRRARAWIDLAGSVFFLVPFAVVMLWVSWGPVVRSWGILETSPDPGGLPRYPIKTVILISFFLLLLQAFSEIVKNAAILVGADPAGKGGEGSTEPPSETS